MQSNQQEHQLNDSINSNSSLFQLAQLATKQAELETETEAEAEAVAKTNTTTELNNHHQQQQHQQEGLILSTDGLTINYISTTATDTNNTNNSPRTVHTNNGLSMGDWYIEFNIRQYNSNNNSNSNDSALRLGIIRIDDNTAVNNNELLGTTDNSYCYLSNGNKAHSNHYNLYGLSYTANDIIGLLIHLELNNTRSGRIDNSCLIYYHNGIQQLIAYTGLTNNTNNSNNTNPSNNTSKYYPAITIQPNSIISIRFKPIFHYPPRELKNYFLYYQYNNNVSTIAENCRLVLIQADNDSIDSNNNELECFDSDNSPIYYNPQQRLYQHQFLSPLSIHSQAMIQLTPLTNSSNSTNSTINRLRGNGYKKYIGSKHYHQQQQQQQQQQQSQLLTNNSNLSLLNQQLQSPADSSTSTSNGNSNNTIASNRLVSAAQQLTSYRLN